MSKRHLYVVDDEQDILDLLEYCLRKEGYEVSVFQDAPSALESFESYPPDLILSDWNMPIMDGLEFCRAVKFDNRYTHIPFVMITCRDDEIDIVSALELGAEEYLVKPFRIRELITRLKKIIKRAELLRRVDQDTHQTPSSNNSSSNGHSSINGNGHESEASKLPLSSQPDVVKRGELMIDPDTYQALLEGFPLDLTFTEFNLLLLLAKRPGRVFSRNQIIELMNGEDYWATERSVDVQVVGLRKKMGKYRSMIETVRSVGYRFSTKY